jgi:hypothetical protein
MRDVEPVEYVLRLGTGETISVCELNPESVDGLVDERVLRSLEASLDRCARVPKVALEEAKRGHTKKLEACLRTPPIGAMLKLDRPVCKHIMDCVMADKRVCSTRNVSESGGAFPLCWEYSSESEDQDVRTAAESIMNCVVHAWRNGRTVLIVTE